MVTLAMWATVVGLVWCSTYATMCLVSLVSRSSTGVSDFILSICIAFVTGTVMFFAIRSTICGLLEQLSLYQLREEYEPGDPCPVCGGELNIERSFGFYFVKCSINPFHSRPASEEEIHTYENYPQNLSGL